MHYPYNLVIMIKMRAVIGGLIDVAKMYYQNNQDRIEKVISFLSVQESKDVF